MYGHDSNARPSSGGDSPIAKVCEIRSRIDRSKVERALRSSCKKGTYAALSHLAKISKDQVPLDKGPLMNSCYVDVSYDGKSGTVSYDTPYAVRQHEVMWYRHRPGRKAKYLEDPLNDPAVHDGMVKLIQQNSKKYF